MTRYRKLATIGFDIQPQPAHIHMPGDGKGARHVFVDGVKLERCFYADTQRGFARYHLDPVRSNRRMTGVRWAKKRGAVTVAFVPKREIAWKRAAWRIKKALYQAWLLASGWMPVGDDTWRK